MTLKIRMRFEQYVVATMFIEDRFANSFFMHCQFLYEHYSCAVLCSAGLFDSQEALQICSRWQDRSCSRIRITAANLQTEISIVFVSASFDSSSHPIKIIYGAEDVYPIT